MLKWTAQPLSGINGVRFGMSRAEVRSTLGGEYKEFKKGRFSKNTTDNFGMCHVFYDPDDACEAVEVFRECEVSINGTVIFPLDLEAVKRMIPDLMEEDGSYISRSQSIGIYAPDGTPESILFGLPGYYD